MYVMARPNRNLVKYTFYIDKRHLAELKTLASYEDRYASDIIREAIAFALGDKKYCIEEKLQRGDQDDGT